MMTLLDLLTYCDHTLLRPDATWDEIRQLCDEGATYHCASVCIPPSFVARAAQHLGGRVPIATVIGFPNGYHETAVKVLETELALANGAQEIDMVVNLGWVKDGLWDAVLADIKAVKAACGSHILKVIIETYLLTQAEKIKLCQLVGQSGAAYIKTSTGFAGGGATREDVSLMKAHLAQGVSIKASGGIRTVQDGLDFIALGAQRLGTSALVALAKQ